MVGLADRAPSGLAERYDAALASLVRFQPAVESDLDALVTEQPDFVPAALAKAYLGVLTSEPGPSREALTVLSTLAARVPTDRLTSSELGHYRAVEAWATGRFLDAQEALDGLLTADPNDLLALFAGHQLDFFLGDAVSLRDRIGRVMPEWDTDHPAHGFLLGMLAFGLEECGWYDRAEEAGTEALAAHPEDVWALHAVVHTHEMRGQVDRGLALLDRFGPHWTEGNLFKTHNFWHQALYYLELGDTGAVLDIYDRSLHHEGSPEIAMTMLDASSLLWRLLLEGTDVGPRWEVLADSWQRWMDEPYYVFNDCHAVMAFVGAGRLDDAERCVAALRRSAEGVDAGSTNVGMTREVGLPVAEALLAFGASRYEEVIDRLVPIRGRLYRFGGSHAQRDAFHRTLLEAALRAKAHPLARLLINERLTLKEDSPYNWWARQRLLEATGHAADARRAAARGASLRAGFASRRPTA